MTNPTQFGQYINKINARLFEPEKARIKIAEEEAIQYFDSVQRYFHILFAEIQKDTTISDSLFKKMCDTNGLYAMQLKAGFDVPANLKDIAHDFDNISYPGREKVLHTILENGYAIQRQ